MLRIGVCGVLYISRLVNDPVVDVKYGVVDTDDDVETLVGLEKLSDIVIRKHMHIEGVIVDTSDSGLYLKDAVPYQDMRYYSAKQAKAKTMLGVDVRVWRNIITGVLADGTIAKTDVRIRLSDYGTELAGGSYLGWTNISKLGQMMTIVLDDKIKDFDCSSHRVYGVRFDISEVTNQAIIDALFYRMSFILNNPRSFNRYLIDRQHRFDDMWRS